MHARSVRLLRLAGLAGLLAAAVAPIAALRAVAEPAGTAPAGVAAQVVAALDALFAGPHAGVRAVHAKGVLCEGVFVASPGAAALSRAVHFSGAETPVLVRFSNFPGVPGLADGDPLSSPRGMAIKFLLPDGDATDLVAHSYDGFPAATPEEFRDFLRALAHPGELGGFLAGHAAARAFMETPKPAPFSYATEDYHGVSAFLFTDRAGRVRAGRYHVAPAGGAAHLTQEEAGGRADTYLAQELRARLEQGPAEFLLSVQVAAEGDDVANGSVPWPAERPRVEVGRVWLTGVIPDSTERQRRLMFMPTNVTDGIAPSADPMLLARTRTYRLSGERRGAGE